MAVEVGQVRNGEGPERHLAVLGRVTGSEYERLLRWSGRERGGGAEGVRTPDLLNAIQE